MSSIWDGLSLGRPLSLDSLSSASTDTPSPVGSPLSEELASGSTIPPATPAMSSPVSPVIIPHMKKHQKYTEYSSVKIVVNDGPDLLEYDLPRQPFLHHSSFFRDLLAQPPGLLLPGRVAAPEGIENAYFLDATPAEFDSFLSILYPNNYATLDLTLASEWTAVLKLATRWHISSIRELAIGRLLDLLLDDPVERLVAARTYDIEQWVDSARLALCAREEPLGAEEIALLAPMDVAFIAQGRVAHAVSAMRPDPAPGQSQQLGQQLHQHRPFSMSLALQQQHRFGQHQNPFIQQAHTQGLNSGPGGGMPGSAQLSAMQAQQFGSAARAQLQQLQQQQPFDMIQQRSILQSQNNPLHQQQQATMNLLNQHVQHGANPHQSPQMGGQPQPQRPALGLPPEQLDMLRTNTMSTPYLNLIQDIFQRVGHLGPEHLLAMLRQLRGLQAEIRMRNQVLQNQARAGANSLDIARQTKELLVHSQHISTLADKVQSEIQARRDKGQLSQQALAMIQAQVKAAHPPPHTLPNGLTNPEWLKRHGAPGDLFSNMDYTQAQVEEAVARIRHHIQQQVQTQDGHPAAQSQAQVQLEHLQLALQPRVPERQQAHTPLSMPPGGTPNMAHASPMQPNAAVPQPQSPQSPFAGGPPPQLPQGPLMGSGMALQQAKVQQALQAAVTNASADELRARGVGEDVIAFVDTNRETLLNRAREQGLFKQALTQPGAPPPMGPGQGPGQGPAPPGQGGVAQVEPLSLPTREQLAQRTLQLFGALPHARDLKGMRVDGSPEPQVMATATERVGLMKRQVHEQFMYQMKYSGAPQDTDRQEWDRLLDRGLQSAVEIEKFLAPFIAYTQKVDQNMEMTMRKALLQIMTLQFQKRILTTPQPPKYIIDLNTLHSTIQHFANLQVVLKNRVASVVDELRRMHGVPPIQPQQPPGPPQMGGRVPTPQQMGSPPFSPTPVLMDAMAPPPTTVTQTEEEHVAEEQEAGEEAVEDKGLVQQAQGGDEAQDARAEAEQTADTVHVKSQKSDDDDMYY